MDLWGPYKIQNLNGAHSFLTIVGDCSRSTWTYLLQNKYQVPGLIKDFLKMISTQFQSHVKVIRTGHVAEFVQETCGEMFRAQGIIHQKSVVGKPQDKFAPKARKCIFIGYPIIHMLKSTNSRGSPCFSDIVAIQLYRIAFLVLKFLCLQADDALRRAEELGSVDLSHFPELPDPEILHGLQDQAVAIATEVCEANKLKSMDVDAQDVCLLMLKILEMALHLEFCVSQICGIRPVMGRVEEFSKQMRLLARATEGQTFLKSSMKHLKQIVSFMYPGLLQSEGIL
ncbi:uncharacterized protein LOC141649895 [Silene latifolia]|uniref:uncharacterized protein LOC141649895 n=1 Tax=Silene latifolia TaxID=37657 RepID=UPI003D786E79